MKARFFPLMTAFGLILGMMTISVAAIGQSDHNQPTTAVALLDAQIAASNDSDVTVLAPYENIPEAVSALDASSLTPIIESEEAPNPMSARTTLGEFDIGSTPCGSYEVALGTNQLHLLHFQISSTKVLFSKFESSNSQFAFALFSFAADGTPVQETNYYLAGSSIKLVLPAGNYAFAVDNAGTTYGDKYTLRVNTSTPGDGVTAADIYKIYDNYASAIVLVTKNGTTMVYCDGKFITNLPDTTNLNWERVLDSKYGNGSWNYNKHEIYNATVNDISFPGTYSSEYVNSSNAVVIFLGAGTGYMYNESKYSEISGNRVFHFNDPFGNTTPRTLDNYDVATYQCWLIYDLNKEKSIDFWSSLNWYYATGTETAGFTYN